MKKKTIITVAIILAVFITGLGGAALLSQHTGISVSTGRILISENGTYFLVRENTPIRLSPRNEERNSLPELESGDRVIVLHDGIAESYPASTGVYFCKKTGSGSISDISPDVISSMKTLGWIKEDFDGKTQQLKFEAQYIRTELPFAAPGGTLTFPMFTTIENTEGLDNYCREKPSGINEAFLDAVKKYDDSFFTENLLFIAHLEEGSGSNTHEIEKIVKSGNSTSIHINTITPEVGTCDMAYHRIIIELKKTDTEGTDFCLFFNGTKALNNWKEIKAEGSNSSISLSLPEDWRYTENRDENGGFGISLYHYSAPESTVTIEFSEFFGVCGTGLTTKDTRINTFPAHMGIYDGNPTFDYIVFEDTPGYYVIKNNADISWWRTHGEDMRAIFETLRIANGIIFRTEAVEIASKLSSGEYKRQISEYNTKTGLWEITFVKDETEQVVFVDKTGNITP